MMSLTLNTGPRSAARRFTSARNSLLARGLMAVLLGLPMWVGLTAEATAQAVNADGSYTVPQDWALKPSAISAGGSFRLMFGSSTIRTAQSSNIADYNTHVQSAAASGHASIRPYSSAFRVLGSTATVAARDNAMTTGTGVPIYWLGGAKVADNYSDFHDSTWDSSEVRNESAGTVSTSTSFWTGSNDDGTGRDELGAGSRVRAGSGDQGLSAGSFRSNSSSVIGLFALSPIFVVASTTSVITIAAGTSPVTEGTDADFTVTATPAPSANLTVNLSVADASGSDFVASGNEGAQTVTVTTSGSAIYSVSTVADAADEPNGPVTVTVTGNTTYTVDSSQNSASVTINDDEPTVVSLTRTGTGAIDEGGTVGFTIALGRALIAGEVIDVPLSISGTNVTTDDWSLAADGTGVTLSGETTMIPQLRFSGANAETATLVLTTTEDSTAESGGFETYTIALGPNDDTASGFDLTSRGTNVGGGADPSGTANSFDVRVNDPSVSVIITETSGGTTMAEAGATDLYGMTLSAQPTADVTIAATSGTPGTATVSGSLVFTGTNWNIAQSITVTAVTNAVDTANQEVTITHAATSTDLRYNGLSLAPVTATVIDDDPTVVTLTRFIGTGAISEGGQVALSIALSRTLAAGEIIDVPLSIGGTGVTTADWSLVVAAGGGLNQVGVSLSGQTTPTPQVTLAGAGTRDAVLLLNPADDGTAEGDGFETYTIALGPDGGGANGFDRATLNTNVGGGADPHGTTNSLDLRVNDPPAPDVIITETGGDTTVDEDRGTDNYGMTLDTQPTANVTIAVTSGTPTFATVNPASLIFTSANWNMAQTITVTGVVNGDDAPNHAVPITHAATSTDARYNITPDPVTVTVTDDDPTVVSLGRLTGTGTISEGGRLTIVVSLSRALTTGEIIDVPLSIGGTGVTTADWSLIPMAIVPDDINVGVTLSAADTPTPQLTFSGAGAQTARLELAAADDDTAEGDGFETYTIALGPNGGGANGFDRSTLNTNVDGGADPDTDTSFTSFDLRVNDPPGITITETAITIDEGDEGTYTVVLATQPGAAVTITPTSGTLATATVSPSTLTFTTANWNTAQTITVTGENNNADAADQAVTITHAATGDSTYSALTLDSVTATVTDNDPTLVALARVGSTGAVGEGGTVGFTITLSRALTSGEIIDVPLSISGTNVTTDDWSLALDSSSSNTGVTLSGEATATPRVRIAGSRIANLQLTATADGIAEGGGEGSETYTIALGPNDNTANGFDLATLGTNVGGGADPDSSANTFNVQINDPPPVGVTITETGGNTRPIEGGTTDSYGMVLDSQPTADVTITATSGTPTTATVSGSLVFTSANWNMAQSITVTGVNNDDDAVNQAVTITHAATSSDTNYNLTPDPVTATVIDDDPTTVTLAGAAGNVLAGDDKQITVTLGRGLMNGETLPVRLTFGGSATPGTDYTVTGAAATGITYTGLGGAVGTVTFTGPTSGTTATTATLTLSAVNAGVTVDIDLGTLDADSGTGLSGGAAGTDNLADFNIVTPGVTVTETGGDTTVAEAGGTDNYGIRLSTQPSGSVTITAESDTTSAATVTPTTLTFTTANWNAAQTFTVTGIDNNRDDAMNRRIATISHAAASTTDTNYVSSLDIDDVEVTVTDDDVPVLTVSVDGGHTTIVEGGAERTIVVTSDIPIDGRVSYGSPITPNNLDPTITNTFLTTGDTPMQTFVIASDSGDENNTDDPPGRTGTTGIMTGTGYTLGDPSTVTLRIIDDDPTTVTLAGTAGNINEGASVEITVTLGRELVSGEVLPVPLTLGGTATRGTDYTLTGTPANNIAYNIPDTGNVGTVTFTGPAPAIATLTLAVQVDTTSDATETIDIGLGTLDDTSGTDLEGGAAGTDSLTDFTIMEQPTIVLPPTLTVAEGDTDGVGYPVRLATEPTMSTTITVTGQTGTDLTLDTASLTFTTGNWDTAQMVTVTAGEDPDAATDVVPLTHTATGGNYDALTAVIRVSITDPDMAGVTITETGGGTTVTEVSSGTDSYGMTLDTPPIANVTIAATPGTGATVVNPGSLTFTSANWNMAQTITVIGVNNAADAVNQEVTISHAATSTDTDYSSLTLDSVTATVIDDDPTVVALARIDSTGAVGEGGTIGFTITLSRALASNEIIDVPLSISGTNVTTDDWSLALDSNASNTGVTLSNQATATPRVRFTSSRIANLQLTATADGIAEGGGEGSETYTIALGPNDASANGFDLATLGTNVGGGADPDSSANTFNVQVNDPASASVTITETGGDTTVAEAGGTDNYGMVLSTQPTADVTITATSGTPGTATVSSSLVFTNTNWNMAQSITVTGVNNAADAANQAVTITHAATSSDTRYNLTPDPVTATVIDDEPTDVAIARTGSTGAVGEGGTVGFTITLSRGLVSGEIIDVPLSISGTNVTTDDWSLEIDSSFGNTGVTLSNQATATPRVRFSGSRTARMQLTATADGIAEGGGEGSETYTIALGPNNATANGFDLATLGTNVGGGADPDSSANTFNVQVNDPPPPSAGVTISEARVTVAEPDGTDIYTLVLDTQPAGNVEITVASDTPGAATVAPLSLTFTASNWDTVQTVTVTGVNDNVVGDRTATISHSIDTGDGDGAGYPDGLAIATVAVMVTNDDLPEASFAVASFTTSEGSGTYNVVVDLSPAPAVATTITYTVGGASTATPGTDYTTLTGTVVASASVSSVNISVTITDDRVGETSETVILNLAAGSGYTVGTDRVHTLTITDNEAAGVTVSESRVAVAELDGTDLYTLVLNTQPAGNVEITVASDTTSAATVSPASLTFAAGNWNTAQTVTVTGVNDNVVGDRTATISHSIESGDGDGAGYPDGLAIATVAVTVTDDDVPVASFAVPGFTTNEGSGTYNVVVNLSPVPTANTTITYTVAGTATPGTDYTTLTGTVVASASASSVNIPVAITDDSTQEGSETVILTLAAGSGYTVGTDRVHTLTIADNDPGVIVSDARVTVAEPDGTDIYTLELNTRPAGNVEITVASDTPGAATVAPLSLTFTAGNWNTAQTVTVTGVNDNVGGNRTATISHSIESGDGDGAGYPDGLAIDPVAVTVTDDDMAVGTGAMQAAQEAWLPRFGLTAVEHLLGGLDYRLSVADQPGLSGNVSGLSAGRALHGGGNTTGTGYGLGTDGFGQGGGGGDGLGAGSVDRMLNLSRSLSLRDMLRGSRFVHRGGENGVSVWGQASYSRYEDGQDGITVDGDVTTGMLGVDRDNGRTLLGLALSYSDGDGDWSGTAEQGELSSTLTSLLPYIRHNVTERLQLWAAASYGRGELEQTLEQTSATMSTKHDIEQTSASVGVRGTLLERPLEEGGLTLTLISDAALARIESDDADGVSGMTADTERFRMGLEWSWQLPQADGGRLIPELELGMRYDGGDTSDGLGVELGGGISWQLPSKGLTIDLRGRRLLDHEADERREWGVSGSLRYERQPGSAHGPSLSVRQEYGTAPASGGLDRLLSDSLSDALEEDSSQPGPASGRWSLEGEWGLALSDGATGIPYAGLSSSDAGHDLTLGWRLLSAPGDLHTELDVKALRRRDGEGKTNHGIGAQWKLRW